MTAQAPRAAAGHFHIPFIFPSGYSCNTFDEFATGCQQHWAESQEMLRKGYFETLMVNLGRADLAMAAGAAAALTDRDVGLDQFLAKLPNSQPAQLVVEPLEVNLGRLAVGNNQRIVLRLRNKGVRLLQGNISCEGSAWLSFKEKSGSSGKVFRFEKEQSFVVYVRGKHLRAGDKPLVGQIAIDSNGGLATVTVRVDVPAQPFPEGVLAGAMKPRQLAEKARDHPEEAGALMAAGLVNAWYKSNGWVYPVRGPSASGIAAVQQFFEALGLVKPPRVELSEDSVRLHGRPEENLEHVLSVLTQENRVVVAHGTSDQPWLMVGQSVYRGRMSFLPLTVPTVPDRPGETLHAQVSVTANGGQSFQVPVTLIVSEKLPFSNAAPIRPAAVRKPIPVSDLHRKVASVAALTTPLTGKDALPPAPLPTPVAAISTNAPAPIVPISKPAFAPPIAKAVPVARAVAPPPTPVPVPTSTPPQKEGPKGGVIVLPANKPSRAGGFLFAVLPALLLILTLGGVILHDYLEVAESSAAPLDAPLDPVPRIELRFHDEKIRDDLETLYLPDPQPTMRFGLVMLSKGKPVGEGLSKVRLTFDPWGRTNNTCLRLDGDPRLFGGPKGIWRELAAKAWKDANGTSHEGARSIWICEDKQIQVTQFVELIRGEQSNHLDTCQVRYLIENRDTADHKVGIRFLLDTFIGGNDGVPFTIPGEVELCDTSKDLPKQAKDKKVPDFLQALEKPDLAKPGTVAHLRLKLENADAPVRVTLGAWPDQSLRVNSRSADGPNTLWDVPVISIKTLKPPDSAVTIYWEEKALKGGASRTVGFDYGLYPILSSKDSHLAVAVDGARRPQGQLTVVAYVNRTGLAKDAALTLSVPEGFALIEGAATQPVPELAKTAHSAIVPVTWKVRAGPVGKYVNGNGLRVTSRTGQTQTVDVEIRSTIFD